MATQLPRALRTSGIMAGAAALLVVATACGSATGQVVTGTAPAGTVTGTFVREGGPMGPGGRQPAELRLRGLIQFIGKNKRTFTVRAGDNGTFEARLPTGTYSVVGRTPRILEVDGNGHQRERPCSQPLSVTVTNHHTSKITVTCVVP
jgi:hypothetical protein